MEGDPACGLALADEEAECSSWDSDDEYQKFIQNMNPPRKVSTDEGEAKAQEHGAMFMETSAKAGFNVKPLFRKIAGSLLGLDALSSGKQEDMVDINLRPASGSSASGAAAQLEQKSGGCSC
ncbi:Ras-related protein RABH1b [Zea mays]|nr:Ras-related protein RABH1b [Zea mays]